MDLNRILTDPVKDDDQDKYREEMQKWEFVDKGVPNEERTIKTMTLEDSVKGLRAIIKPSAPRVKETTSQEETILFHMAVWIQVSFLIEQVRFSTEGDSRLEWEKVGIDLTHVETFLKEQTQAWTSARKELEHRENNDENETRSWNVEEELQIFLESSSYAFMLGEAEIDAGLDMAMDAYENSRGEATNNEGKQPATGLPDSGKAYGAATEIIPIEKLEDLSYEVISGKLASELKHKIEPIGNYQMRKFEEEVKYFQAIVIHFAWVSTLNRTLAKKRNNKSPADTFTSRDVSKYFGSQEKIFTRSHKRLEEKMRKEHKNPDALETAKKEVVEKLKDEGSLHLNKVDVENILKDLNAKTEFGAIKPSVAEARKEKKEKKCKKEKKGKKRPASALDEQE